MNLLSFTSALTKGQKRKKNSNSRSTLGISWAADPVNRARAGWRPQGRGRRPVGAFGAQRPRPEPGGEGPGLAGCYLRREICDSLETTATCLSTRTHRASDRLFTVARASTAAAGDGNVREPRRRRQRRRRRPRRRGAPGVSAAA